MVSMNIECCVCDMDGTLLNSNNQLSTENIKAIHKLHESGIEVILATGRPDFYVKDTASKLRITKPIITCNGGMIRDVWTGETFFAKTIPHKIAESLVETFLENKFDMLFYTPKWIYYSHYSNRIEWLFEYNRQVQESFRMPLQEISSVTGVPLTHVFKFFLWQADSAIIAKLKKAYSKELAMIQSMHGAIDIMAIGVSKGKGLSFLARIFGIDLKKTAVFGDNCNDISMFEIAGMPIAMCNAVDKLKAVSKYVTASNDEDGVALAIRKLILRQN
jgi:Cof subfamily protein (haloacid dehalogenase superfamily)